jgi:hypothetical protein
VIAIQVMTIHSLAATMIDIGLKYKDEFGGFFFRLSLPLIRQFRGVLGQIRGILEEYRVDRKGMKRGHILP